MPTEERYYVTRRGNELEVSVEDFVKAEREAGFRGPGHHLDPVRPATSSFTKSRYDSVNKVYDEISGRTAFIPIPVEDVM